MKMELLNSNYPPVRCGGKSFSDAFYSLLPRTTVLDIAVGYVTADSLAELQRIVELYGIKRMNLTIGMHYLDRFTHNQYNAAMHLNDFLMQNGGGEVRLVTPFRYHGKLYSYSNENGAFAGIIGSNNLSSIIDGGVQMYESSLLIDDCSSAHEIKSFIDSLVHEATENIADLEITDFNKNNPLLEGLENVNTVSETDMAECRSLLTATRFEIPVKCERKSNLNTFFGKGRKSKNGIVKPRHWYEVELIVPKKIAACPEYPHSQTPEAEFDVITDDGWTFKCKISGDYNKNFRSEGDLTILGKWLKGRLENADVLKIGTPVTEQTLRDYGRDSFSLIKTSKPNTWYLDFGVEK